MKANTIDIINDINDTIIINTDVAEIENTENVAPLSAIPIFTAAAIFKTPNTITNPLYITWIILASLFLLFNTNINIRLEPAKKNTTILLNTIPDISDEYPKSEILFVIIPSNVASVIEAFCATNNSIKAATAATNNNIVDGIHVNTLYLLFFASY